MMMLGLVLHAGISYCVEDQGNTWPLKDTGSTSYMMDYLVGYIHIFRMPIFFVIAGFFGALLFYERSPSAMLKNRIKRILFPFLVFVVLLWPILGGSYMYTYEAFTGASVPQASDGFMLKMLIPQSSFHLWFLQYLFMISVIFWRLAYLMKQLSGLTQSITKWLRYLLANPVLKIAFTTAVVFGILNITNEVWVDTTNYFTPNWKTLLFYSSFYLMGWCIFKVKDLLPGFKQYDWFFVLASLLLCALILVFKADFSEQVHMLLNALTVSLCLFGITGLFLRYCSHHSARMRYVSDASYWVYIIHMPLCLLGPGLLAPFALPAEVKFLIVFSVAAIIAFVSYHYMVRSTFIGKFLNGRKYA